MRRTSGLFFLVWLAACDCGDGGGLSQVEGRLLVEPTNLDFGPVAPNTTATRTFQLANTGRTDIDVALSTDGLFRLGVTPARLRAGESADVTVEFLGAAEPGGRTGRVAISHEAEGPRAVLLYVRVEDTGVEPECEPVLDPESVHFDGFDSAPVAIANEGDGDCTIDSVAIEGTGFEVTAASTPIALAAGGATSLEVRRTGGTAATLVVMIDGARYELPLTARVDGPHLCVAPQSIVFGSAAEARDLELTSCGGQPIRIDSIGWSTAAAELDVFTLPAFPLQLVPGATLAVTVRYTPADDVADRAALHIRSNDALAPELDVPVSTSPEMLPEEVGRFLYYWGINETEGSNIMKLPLQGSAGATAFWGESTGQGCPGCHQISPDGRYVAITELGGDDENITVATYVVDTTNNRRIDLAAPASSALGFSWAPDVGGATPYRFVFAAGGRIHLGALSAGYLGELPGASSPDAELGQAMPSWGSDGRIVFVRGMLEDEGFGFYDFADLYVIPETGGTATAVAGASGNGMTSYYPAFSPDGRWIAYTETALGDTYAAPDARVRLVRADGSGVVARLDLLNGPAGATTFPSWSIDGTYLSVSSNRAGGAGDWDVYVAPIDLVTGADGAAANVAGANTAGFEHGAQWSP